MIRRQSKIKEAGKKITKFFFFLKTNNQKNQFWSKLDKVPYFQVKNQCIWKYEAVAGISLLLLSPRLEEYQGATRPNGDDLSGTLSDPLPVKFCNNIFP